MPIKKGTLAGVFEKRASLKPRVLSRPPGLIYLGEELRQEVPRKGKELNGTQITPGLIRGAH